MLHHRVDGFFELENFTADIHGNLSGQVSVGDGDGHLSDIADLTGKVRGHPVDVVREVLPGSGHTKHFCLTTQLSVCSHFTRDARHF